MNAAACSVAPTRGSSFISARLVDLERIFEPAFSLVAWRRPRLPIPAADFSPWLTRPHRFVRDLAAADCTPATLADHCKLDPASALAEDLAALSELFATLSGAERIGLRVEVTDARTCPRLHVDNVAVRQLCTYLGPATQWVDSKYLDRRKLGAGAAGEPDATSGLLRVPNVVRELQRYDVALLKGERWPGNEGYGAVHRSPAVPRGELRVLVSWDML
jgi:hypothetical protein